MINKMWSEDQILSIKDNNLDLHLATSLDLKNIIWNKKELKKQDDTYIKCLLFTLKRKHKTYALKTHYL